MKPQKGTLPVVAVDMDHVLLDNFDVWSAHFRLQRCGSAHADRPTGTHWDRWEHLCPVCWNDVLHQRDILLAHELRPGVERTLDFLSRIAELHLVTSRPLDTEEITKEWLFWREILPYFKGIHLSHNKREKCDELGAAVLLDDGPHNIKALAGSNTIPVIFDADYNRDLEGIRVHDWDEAYKKIGILILER